MAGLLGYAAAGALAGAGKGIVERAQAVREAAMAKMRRDQDVADRDMKRQWQLDDKAPQGGGGRRGLSPKPASGGSSAGVVWEGDTPYASEGARVISRYKHDDGTWRGFVGGQEVMLRGADGGPTMAGGNSRNPELPPRVGDSPAMPAEPEAPRGLPAVGEEVEGYRFKGGNPNEQGSWEKVSATSGETRMAQSGPGADEMYARALDAKQRFDAAPTQANRSALEAIVNEFVDGYVGAGDNGRASEMLRWLDGAQPTRGLIA